MVVIGAIRRFRSKAAASSSSFVRVATNAAIAAFPRASSEGGSVPSMTRAKNPIQSFVASDSSHAPSSCIQRNNRDVKGPII